MNSDFQKKLFQYQATPPAHTWNEIADALDQEKPAFAARLFRFQVRPAKEIWSRINAALSEGGTPHRVVLLRRKALLYAAAAVLIVLAGFGIYLMAPADKAQATTSAATLPVLRAQDRAEPITEITQPAEVREAGNETTESPVASNTLKKRNLTRKLAARLLPIDRKAVVPTLNAAKKELALPAINMVNAARDDRYMIATATDGKVVRLPKKAYAAFACVEVTDLACREKIATMQSRMATASLTTDFAGFLDLLNNLQDQ